MLKNCLLGISILALVFAFSSCSSDDDNGGDCASCELQGETIEFCDNGDGTYTLSAAGQSETVTEEELEGISPQEYVDVICGFGDFIP